MSFFNYFSQPLRQVLFEVDEHRRRLDVSRSINNRVIRSALRFPTKFVAKTASEVVVKQPASIDRASHHIKAAPPTPAAPSATLSAGSVVAKLQPVIKDKGIARLEAACSISAGSATPVVAVQVVPKVCRFFSVNGKCKFKNNCHYVHDYAALTTSNEAILAKSNKAFPAKPNKELAEPAIKKLGKVRSDQQLAYNKQVLQYRNNYLKNNCMIKPSISTAAKPIIKPAIKSNIKSTVRVSGPRVAPSKAPTKKKIHCFAYVTFRGCQRKNCPYPHINYLLEPKKLIDEKVEESKEPPVIVWEGNPNLGNPEWMSETLTQILGWEGTSDKGATIGWCKEMASNGNFKHFTSSELNNLGVKLCLTKLEFYVWIVSTPDVIDRVPWNMKVQALRYKAAYDAEQARPKYDTFHYFEKLPVELRIKIWRFAHNKGRMLRAAVNKGKIYPKGINGPGLLKRRSPPSELWQVNKLSQESAGLDIYCGFYFGCDFFSPGYDTLFLQNDASDIHRFAKAIRAESGDQVQRLTLQYSTLEYAFSLKEISDDLRIAFPNLIRVEVLLSDAHWHKDQMKNHGKFFPKVVAAIKKAYETRTRIGAPRIRLKIISQEAGEAIGITFW